ncbi:hypothetical protein Bca52824_057404 [Brassica carinata]|uniref:Uncharacterized protein n=1 Tax=Brassica carinata TaxID=52824 RepID=A0A8X7QQD3_BRACI|nr:hypothetical protein Bca52824_057404 [Brassica carinata]
MVSFGDAGVHPKLGQPRSDNSRPQRCGIGPVEDRKLLAALSIFTGFIEGRKFSTATRSTRKASDGFRTV